MNLPIPVAVTVGIFQYPISMGAFKLCWFLWIIGVIMMHPKILKKLLDPF